MSQERFKKNCKRLEQKQWRVARHSPSMCPFVCVEFGEEASQLQQHGHPAAVGVGTVWQPLYTTQHSRISLLPFYCVADLSSDKCFVFQKLLQTARRISNRLLRRLGGLAVEKKKECCETYWCNAKGVVVSDHNNGWQVFSSDSCQTTLWRKYQRIKQAEKKATNVVF